MNDCLRRSGSQNLSNSHNLVFASGYANTSGYFFLFPRGGHDVIRGFNIQCYLDLMLNIICMTFLLTAYIKRCVSKTLNY